MFFFFFFAKGGTAEHPSPVRGSSNFPLRGHKYSWFEGGVRAASFVASPLLPAAVRGTRSDGLFHISDWWATFASLAGLEPEDNCDGCVHLDGLDIWPDLTDPGGPAARTELLLGVTAGAYRNGSHKLIAAPNGADGYSAQYPGSTPAPPAPAGPGCQTEGKPYCLFDVELDPREQYDLFHTHPALGAALYARYQELAKEMRAPNADDHDSVRDHPLRCDTDLCWEWGAVGLVGPAGAPLSTLSTSTPPPCSPAGDWHLGADAVFSFDPTGAGFDMTIKQGCASCTFTRGTGTTDGATVKMVASGKGEWIDEEGLFLSGCDRIHWTSHNVTGHGDWADFCRGSPCTPAPKPKSAACSKMLETGYWAPWVE